MLRSTGDRMNKRIVFTLLVAISFVSACLIGCKSSDDGLTTEQHQTQDRFTQIMERSGGKWENLTEDEHKFMVDLANGNEQAAKTMFTMRAMRAQGAPGGGRGPAAK